MSPFLKYTKMFGCRVTVLQNMVCSNNILAVLRHWIPRSTNCLTIAIAEKANYNKKSLESVSLMIMIIMVVNLKLIGSYSI